MELTQNNLQALLFFINLNKKIYFIIKHNYSLKVEYLATHFFAIYLQNECMSFIHSEFLC